MQRNSVGVCKTALLSIIHRQPTFCFYLPSVQFLSQQRAAIKHKLITRSVHVFATAIKIFPLFLYIYNGGIRSRRCDSGGSSWASGLLYRSLAHTDGRRRSVVAKRAKFSDHVLTSRASAATCVIFEAARKITPF
jgi:hypothetical protein